MSLSFNKVVLGGTLTRDPELREAGKAKLAKFTIAINRKSKTAEEVSFIDITAWDKQAEVIAKHLRKGQSILLEGRLKQDTWKDKTSGQNRSKIGVVLEGFTFVGSKRDGEAGQPVDQPADPPATPATDAPASQPPPVDDDVPF